MATTTFSGPIKAGTISNTTGTTLGDNVRNTGQVTVTFTYVQANNLQDAATE